MMYLSLAPSDKSFVNYDVRLAVSRIGERTSRDLANAIQTDPDVGKQF